MYHANSVLLYLLVFIYLFALNLFSTMMFLEVSLCY